MILRYVMPDGEVKEKELGKEAVTIGRSPDVDVCVSDKLLSRIHCGISYWDNAFFIRDFKSRNGTFVNDRKVDVAKLNAGDRIRVGETILTVEAHTSKGTETVEGQERMGTDTAMQAVRKDSPTDLMNPL